MTSSPLEPPPDDAEDDDGVPDDEIPPVRRLDVLARRLAEVEETMRREHDRAAHRERVIDRLHAENQELRHGLLEEALNPVRAGLYRLYDNARRQAARWRAEPPSPEHAASLLEALADELAEVLGRAGAERIPVRPGDLYDPVIHRPVRTAPVGPDADGTVVEVLADGFAGVARGGDGAIRERVVRKASVVVGRGARTADAGRAAGETADGGGAGDGEAAGVPDGTRPPAGAARAGDGAVDRADEGADAQRDAETHGADAAASGATADETEPAGTKSAPGEDGSATGAEPTTESTSTGPVPATTARRHEEGDG